MEPILRLTAVAAAMVFLAATSADAQQLKRGELTGTVVSASATAPPLSSVSLLTAPASGHFIVTQVCGGPIEGSTIGTLSFGGGCTEFVPGFALPANEELEIRNEGASFDINGLVTGVESKN